MMQPTGFEPPTFGTSGFRSTQFNYISIYYYIHLVSFNKVIQTCTHHHTHHSTRTYIQAPPYAPQHAYRHAGTTIRTTACIQTCRHHHTRHSMHTDMHAPPYAPQTDRHVYIDRQAYRQTGTCKEHRIDRHACRQLSLYLSQPTLFEQTDRHAFG